jgi:hypothetical protein
MQSDVLRGVARVTLIDNGTHDAEPRHIQVANAALSSFLATNPAVNGTVEFRYSTWTGFC